jgi:hypothetical protein
MIYANEARAREAAAELNTRKGYGETRAVLTPQGWTIICNWVW